MSLNCGGVLLYVTGSELSETPSGWHMSPDDGADIKQAYDHRKLRGSVSSLDFTNATLELLAASTAVSSNWQNNRTDVVWWISQPSLESWHEYINGILTGPLLSQVQSPGAPWPDQLAWGENWHTVTDGKHLTFAYTNESRSPSRIWFIRTDRPYIKDDASGGQDYDHSISSLTETDDMSGYRGALADYIVELAGAYQHLRTSTSNNELLSQLVDQRLTGLDVLGLFAQNARNQNDAAHALRATSHNLSRARTVLGERLGDFVDSLQKIDDFGGEQQQGDEAIATVEFNAHRAESAQQHLRSQVSLIETRLSKKATTANTYATLFLTVSAGGIGAAQIPEANIDRFFVGVLFSSILTSVGLLILEATTDYTKAQAGIIAISTAMVFSTAAAIVIRTPLVPALLFPFGLLVGFLAVRLVERVRTLIS